MEHSGALWGILEYSGAFWSTLEYSGVLRSTLEYFFSIIFGVILIFEAFLASFLSREETRNLVDETISRENFFCEKIGNTSRDAFREQNWLLRLPLERFSSIPID